MQATKVLGGPLGCTIALAIDTTLNGRRALPSLASEAHPSPKGGGFTSGTRVRSKDQVVASDCVFPLFSPIQRQHCFDDADGSQHKAPLSLCPGAPCPQRTSPLTANLKGYLRQPPLNPSIADVPTAPWGRPTPSDKADSQ